MNTMTGTTQKYCPLCKFRLSVYRTFLNGFNLFLSLYDMNVLTVHSIYRSKNLKTYVLQPLVVGAAAALGMSIGMWEPLFCVVFVHRTLKSNPILSPTKMVQVLRYSMLLLLSLLVDLQGDMCRVTKSEKSEQMLKWAVFPNLHQCTCWYRKSK